MRFRAASYPKLHAFAAVARPRDELWRTATGFLLIIAMAGAGSVLFYFFLSHRYGAIVATAIEQAMARGATPGLVILMLFTFLILACCPIAVVRGLHGRRAGTLFGPLVPALAGFAPVAMVVFGANLLTLPFQLGDPAVARGVDLGPFVAYLPAALLGLLIQTSAEELVFRGYLLQQLAARFPSPLAWMVLPSAVFAAAHYDTQIYGQSALIVCFWIFLFGCLAADLTARTGGLGAAIGFHFANNAAAFLLVGSRGELDGLALWTRQMDLGSPTMTIDLLVNGAVLIVAWLGARIALRL